MHLNSKVNHLTAHHYTEKTNQENATIKNYFLRGPSTEIATTRESQDERLARHNLALLGHFNLLTATRRTLLCEFTKDL